MASRYSAMRRDCIDDAEECIIGYDDLREHPRGSVGIRYGENKIRYYNIEVIKKIKDTTGVDPFTRAKFSNVLKQRIDFYSDGYTFFPDHNVDKDALYKGWMESFSKKDAIEDRRKAECFLTMEDFKDVFKNYEIKNVKGVSDKEARLKIREKACEDLSNSKIGSWLIRDSSIQSKYTKVGETTLLTEAKVITFKADIIRNELIIHRQGMGYFLVTTGVDRGDKIEVIIGLIDRFTKGDAELSFHYEPSFLKLLHWMHDRVRGFDIYGNHDNVVSLQCSYQGK